MEKELKEKIEVLEKTFEWQEDNKQYIMPQTTPQELKDIFFKNDFDIDDYNYEWFNEAFDYLLEAIGETKEIDEAVSIVEDFEFEFEADIYTSDLTKWLNSSAYRPEYLGQAVREMEATDGIGILSMAQYLEKGEIFENARRSFVDYLQLNREE